MSRTALRRTSHALIGLAVALSLTATASAAPKKPGGTTSGSQPMSGGTVSYSDRWAGADDCFAKDDNLQWQATGSLKPGETYTYTPERPICADPQEWPHASADLTWSGSQLELTSTIPMGDHLNGGDAYNDGDTRGRQIVAPNVANHAQACMFMDPSAAGVTSNTPYSFTIRNVGTTTADNITLKGEAHNGWPHYWSPDCYNGDADRDGWNDAFEQTTGVLTYYSSAPGLYTSVIGSRYARGAVHTTDRDDEVDAYPPDVNDDGTVDQADADRVAGHVGEGTGVALNRISANRGDAEFTYAQTGVWRRYDLNGDGTVTQADVDAVQKLIGQPYPAPDVQAPTVVARPPGDGTAAPGSYVWIPIDIVDNGLLRSAELQQDGRTLAAIKPDGKNTGYYWQAPKSRRAYTLAAIATDSAGNTSTRTFTIAVK